MNIDKILPQVVLVLALVLIVIATASVIDHRTRSEECTKQQGTMINTPRGILCVLNLTTIPSRKH